MILQNPIIRGFNPDPSICRTGKDYYLVTSSFAFFPGIPVYHSRDLVNWELISHCITKEGMLPLERAESAGGIWAPTIRYHRGRFYVTATFSRFGNFIISAKDPEGPWSEPIWTQVDGIDPSMYFEDDEMYYCTNDSAARRKELGVATEGISLCRMDVTTGKVLGERCRIWSGTGGGWLESPHVYKIGEYYYLLCAEGGTGPMHMATIARSKELFGPYESCPHNPILTNRNDTSKQVICSGHADLFEDTCGKWWIVHLGCRTNINMHSNIGRETFLMPCDWVNGWPRVLPDGQSKLEVDIPISVVQKPGMVFHPDFQKQEWEKKWLFLRDGQKQFVREHGELIVKPSNSGMYDPVGSPGFLCIRQTELEFEFSALLHYQPGEFGDEAGLIVYLDHDFNYKLAVTNINDKPMLVLNKRIDDLDQILVLSAVDVTKDINLTITADKRNYNFLLNSENLVSASTRFMSTDIPDRCFTGTVLGLFVEGLSQLHVKNVRYSI